MKNKLKTGAVLTCLSIGLLHIVNKCICTASTLNNMLFWGDGQTFHWRFGNIYYRKSGSGSPILLIHDLSPFSSSYEWHLLEEELAQKHTVYTLDLLGCGRSDKPNMTYTNYLYVQLITDFIQKVIGQKTDVAATGLSASFVVMACSTTPDLFSKLFLVNPESLGKLVSIPGKRSKIRKFLMEVPVIGTTVYHIMTRRENVEYLFTEKYFYNPFYVVSPMVHAYHEAAHRDDSHGKYLFSSISGNYVNINIAQALKHIDNSIVLLLGDHMEEAHEISAAYTQINPAIETVFLKNTKFLPQLESPQITSTNMSVFLES